MAKRMKFDESGDSDDLQALFDSIATGNEPPQAPVIQQKAPAPAPVFEVKSSEAGDNEDLQALFDSVADEYVQAHPEPEVAAAPQAETRPEQNWDSVFNKIGMMTRQLHDTLRELGYDQALQEAASAIPDARQRLSYIAQMTEQAASRVLNATDIAKPIQDKVQADAESLRARWDQLYSNQLSVEGFKTLAGDTRAFLGSLVESSQATNAQLLEIMMAQDFQDLTGQVIKRVVDMAQSLESQLLQVLIDSMPADKKIEAPDSLMNGPVINSVGREDVVTSQEQVDDLLESLGF